MEQAQEKHIIWSSLNLELEEWRGFLEEEYPDRTEEEYYSLMHELNDGYLDDERANLNVQLSTPILVCADLGLWNGRKSGYRMIDSGNIRDCLSSGFDDVEWFVDKKGDLRSTAVHHDGRNHYLYRAVKEHVPDWQVERLQNKLYEGTASEADIDRVTRRLGEEIASVYGFPILETGIGKGGTGEMETVDAQKEMYEEVELLGREGLFTELRVDKETVPEGVYCYELRHGDDNGFPVSVEENVRVNYFGAVLFTEPLDLGEEKALQFGYDDFLFTGDQMYLGQMLKDRKEATDTEKAQEERHTETSLEKELVTGLSTKGKTGFVSGYEILTTGGALAAFMDSHNRNFHLTEKAAGMLCGYMDGHGYVIGQKDGQLYSGDLCKETEKIVWEETTIDDLVDSACEWNYELLQQARAEMENPDNFSDFVEKHSRYEDLSADEKVLDGMFERTKYETEINEIAQILADQLIRDLNSKGGIDAAVKKMTDQIKAGEDLLPDVSPALKKNGGKSR